MQSWEKCNKRQAFHVDVDDIWLEAPEGQVYRPSKRFYRSSGMILLTNDHLYQ